jgi:hypothetical protein
MTKEEKKELFQGIDRAIGLLALYFDPVREVASVDGFKGFHQVLNNLTCEDCNAKLLGLCLGEGYGKVGVLICMEHKDMCLHSQVISMN